MGTIVVLDLMGGVALLLWGLHMVRSGILRTFGPDLRHLLSTALGNRFAAFAAGLGLTALSPAREARGSGNSSAAAELTFSSQFMASERTRPSQPFGGRTFRMKAMVRARSTTSESPYLPGLIQFGPYIASGTLVSYDHGDPWVEA